MQTLVPRLGTGAEAQDSPFVVEGSWTEVKKKKKKEKSKKKGKEQVISPNKDREKRSTKVQER